MIRRLLPDSHVDSLGFLDARLLAPRDGERHFELDLATRDAEALPDDFYDVVVFAEVIEHLYTSPRVVLRMLQSRLRRHGTLVMQTPNAAALSRRFWLFMGRNPFEPIREDLHQAGHFREYTAAELRELCADAGLRVDSVSMRNYFLTGSTKNRILVAVGSLMPPTLRQGITLVAERV